MRFDGTLRSWNDERGFGFIEPAQGGEEIFVHIKAFPGGSGRPAVGLTLSFEVEVGPNGKKRARAVQFAARSRGAKSRQAESPAPWTVPRLLVLPVFIGIWFYVTRQWPVKPVVAAFYVALSIVAFLTYAIDKSAAGAGRRRIPERTLHLLGLAGGWPGALLAQQLLRHKTSKASFIAAFWCTVILNIAAFVGWHTGLLARL